MAYIIPNFTHPTNASDHNDTYCNFAITRYNGIMRAEISIYKDRQSYLGKKKSIYNATIAVTNDDFTLFFTDTVLKEEGKNLKTQMYLFLLSLSADKYPSISFDPQTTIKSLSEDQRNSFTWSEGDIIYNEASSQKEIYTNNQWQPYNS